MKERSYIRGSITHSGIRVLIPCPYPVVGKGYVYVILSPSPQTVTPVRGQRLPEWDPPKPLRLVYQSVSRLLRWDETRLCVGGGGNLTRNNPMINRHTGVPLRKGRDPESKVTSFTCIVVGTKTSLRTNKELGVVKITRSHRTLERSRPFVIQSYRQ